MKNKLKTDSGAIQEALDLLQEECGEVIVEASKCRRFDLEGVHYKTGRTHREMLTQEIADVLGLVDILLEQGIMTVDELEVAKLAKIEKLKTWTNLYE